MHRIVSIAQYVLVVLLALVIFQVIVEQQYSTVILFATYVISYGLWILILALLTRAFFSWYRLSNKSIMVLILALSMIAYVVNGITGLANYSNMLVQQESVITSKDIAYFPEFSIATLGTQINIIYQIAGAGSLRLNMDWSCQAIISLHQGVGKSQVLDHHGCSNGLLSY